MGGTGQVSEYLPVGIIEGDGVDDILVSFQCQQFVSRLGIPDFARPIIAASNEPEGATKVKLNSQLHLLTKRRGLCAYLSPDLLKAQLVSGRMWARKILNR